MQQERIKNAIYLAIDELNEMRSPSDRIEKSGDTVLYGGDDGLDSLDMVNLIVTTESNVEDEFGVTLNLADGQTLANEASPFRKVSTFAQYISELLDKYGHEQRAA